MNSSTGRRLLSQPSKPWRAGRPRQAGRCAGRGLHGHQAAPFSSTPTSSVRGLGYEYGGTRRLIDAGEPSNTRPARSKREPWQGQKKPPGQSDQAQPALEALLRQAAQVRAGADQHQELRACARAARSLRTPAARSTASPGPSADRHGRRGAPPSPACAARHRSADLRHTVMVIWPGIDLRDVEFTGAPWRASALRRGPGLDEGHGSEYRTDSPRGYRGLGKELAPTQVDPVVGDDYVIRHLTALPHYCTPAAPCFAFRANGVCARAVSYFAGGGALYTNDHSS